MGLSNFLGSRKECGSKGEHLVGIVTAERAVLSGPQRRPACCSFTDLQIQGTLQARKGRISQGENLCQQVS